MSGVVGLVSSGPLLLAIPVAAAAGAVTFLSPCVLPLVPGYLSYITGLSGVVVDDDAAAVGTRAQDDAETGASAPAVVSAVAAGLHAGGAVVADSTGAAGVTGSAHADLTVTSGSGRAPGVAGASRRRAVLGTALFAGGFSALFATYGVAFGVLGTVLVRHQGGITRALGVLVIALGLLFAGVFDRFSFAGRIVKPSVRPRVGLASAPLLGVLFGFGWSPCIGPTLGAVLTLGLTTGTAARGALLAFVYGLGLGIPFLVVAFAVERGMAIFGFARRHARLIARIGGLLLVGVGVLEVTGAWTSAMAWLATHWLSGYTAPF